MRKHVVVAVMTVLVLIVSLAFAQSQATLLLRSGERVTGILDDIQNRYVYLNGDEERRIPLEEVVLIDFSGSTRRLDWVDTGIDVVQGDRVYFESSGEIRLSDDRTDIAAVAGSKKQRLAVNSPLPWDFAGALIGRIGGHVFGISNQTSVVMPQSGRLLLGVNDDEFTDNTGAFTVIVRSIEPRR